MYKKTILAIISLVLACFVSVNLTGCASSVTGKNVDDAFIRSQMRLAVERLHSSAFRSAGSGSAKW